MLINKLRRRKRKSAQNHANEKLNHILYLYGLNAHIFYFSLYLNESSTTFLKFIEQNETRRNETQLLSA